jgi:hypothetical protein
MATIESIDTQSPSKRTRTFRKYAPSFRFAPHQAQRQNDLIRSAWPRLKTKEAVIAFLNTTNETIGGQTLILALGSDDGLRSAQRLLGDFVDPVTLR